MRICKGAMRVLIGCEESGTVRRAFRERGHEAWSCDLIPCSDGSEFHYQMDIFKCLETTGPWDLFIFHWPCTFLTRAGAGWLYNTPKKPKQGILYGEPRRLAMIESAHTFKRLMTALSCPTAGENPRPYRDALQIMGTFTQRIQPWQFGHGETKETCLWLRGLEPLKHTEVVSGREQRCHKLPPGKDRAKLRSKTYPGIARAMAEQWGQI